MTLYLDRPASESRGTGSTAYDGRVDVIFGAAVGSDNELNGVYDLNDIGSTFLGIEIDGEAGSAAGYCLLGGVDQ